MEDTLQTKSEKVAQEIHSRAVNLSSHKITEKVIELDLSCYQNDNCSLISKCLLLTNYTQQMTTGDGISAWVETDFTVLSLFSFVFLLLSCLPGTQTATISSQLFPHLWLPHPVVDHACLGDSMGKQTALVLFFCCCDKIRDQSD